MLIELNNQINKTVVIMLQMFYHLNRKFRNWTSYTLQKPFMKNINPDFCSVTSRRIRKFRTRPKRRARSRKIATKFSTILTSCRNGQVMIKLTQDTVTIWIPVKSGVQMVQTCWVVIWSSFLNGGLKTVKKSFFMVSNVCYLNGQPNHVIKPFENQIIKVSEKCMFGFWMSVFR